MGSSSDGTQSPWTYEAMPNGDFVYTNTITGYQTFDINETITASQHIGREMVVPGTNDFSHSLSGSFHWATMSAPESASSSPSAPEASQPALIWNVATSTAHHSPSRIRAPVSTSPPPFPITRQPSPSLMTQFVESTPPVPSNIQPRNRMKPTATELHHVVLLAIEHNPWLHSTRDRSGVYDTMFGILRRKNLCTLWTPKHLPVVLDRLLKHHNEGARPNSDVSRALAQNTHVNNLMPALLDRLTGLRDNASVVRDEHLASARARATHDTEVGEIIRSASMVTRSGHPRIREQVIAAAEVRNAATSESSVLAATSTATAAATTRAPLSLPFPVSSEVALPPHVPSATFSQAPLPPRSTPPLERRNPHYCPGLSPFYLMPPQSLDEVVEDFRESLPEPLEPHEIPTAMENGYAGRYWPRYKPSELVAPQPHHYATVPPPRPLSSSSDDDDLWAFLDDPVGEFSSSAVPHHGSESEASSTPSSTPTLSQDNDAVVVHQRRGANGRFVSQSTSSSSKRGRSPSTTESAAAGTSGMGDQQLAKRPRANGKARNNNAIDALTEHIIAEDSLREDRADRAMERQARVLQSTMTPFLELGAQILKALADDKSE